MEIISCYFLSSTSVAGNKIYRCNTNESPHVHERYNCEFVRYLPEKNQYTREACFAHIHTYLQTSVITVWPYGRINNLYACNAVELFSCLSAAHK